MYMYVLKHTNLVQDNGSTYMSTQAVASHPGLICLLLLVIKAFFNKLTFPQLLVTIKFVFTFYTLF